MTGLCDSLVREHEIIERVLDVLEREARAVTEGAAIDADFFRDAIGFVRQFADGIHHQKEEQVLFPALCEAGMPKDGGPVGVMLFEHDEGRSHIRAMEASLAPAANGDAAARRRVIHEALAYVALLRAHIQKENMILFPMAERVLDPSRQDAVRQRFSALEEQDCERSQAQRAWADSLNS